MLVLLANRHKVRSHLLHLTTKRGDTLLTKFLLDHGADPYAVDTTFYETPLSNAVRFNHLRDLKVVLKKSNPKRAIDQLIGKGLRPLHFAALNGNSEMVEVLVRFGFRVNDLVLKNPYKNQFEDEPLIEEGMTALEAAAALGGSLESSCGAKDQPCLDK